MAPKDPVTHDPYAAIKKLSAAVSVLAFSVIIAGGYMADTRFMTIAYRALVAVLAIKLLTVIVVRILASYEEIERGQG